MQPEEQAEEYELSLTGGGLSLTRKVSSDVARQVLNLVMGGPAQYAAASSANRGVHSNPGSESAPAARPNRERLSLREYLDESEARRNPDKITAIGAFLEEYEGLEDFGREDIKARFRTAGESAPANYPRDFSWAIKSGWIAEDPANVGRYFVTQKGRSAIQAKFSSDVKKSLPRGRSRRGGRREASEGNGGDE